MKPHGPLLTLALALGLLSPPVALAQPVSALEAARAWYWQHPYQPEAINRLALALLEAGDRGGAEILLARAVRIAPDRADLRANLERLRAGASRVDAAPASLTPAPMASTPVSALPAPWPLPH